MQRSYKCDGSATRAVVAVAEKTSLVSLALPEEHCTARSNSVAPPVSSSRSTTKMTTVRMLFFFGTAFFAFAKVRAAPTRYDQRQDGDFNLHAKLENFLFVVVIPNEQQHLSDLALGALEAVISRSKEQELIKSGEVVRQEEPYSVEILHINENRPEISGRKAEGGDVAGTLNVSDQRPAPIGDGQTERIAKNVKNFEFPKSREVPTNSGYFANTRKTLKSKTNNGRARNIWNVDAEPGRPGTSLKKQLSRKGEEDVALLSSNADKNDVSPFSEEKQQELRLLGDGIENCGPGRRRDTSGICQSDGSLL